MPKAPFSDILQYLRRMYPAEDAADRPDSDLLNRFVTQGEDAAFTVLLERHAAMVMGVCVRVLGDLHGAEDAFQATFVVLARRAPNIALRGSLGPWLYAVAQRVALRAKAQTTVQRNRERRYRDMPRAARLDEHTWQELRSVLDEEIGRLPEKYRAPLVLCFFEGKSQDQAAKELGWAKSTLDRRLSRAKELLRKQLTRHGITLSAAALATALCEKVAGAAVSATMTINTVKAATSVLAGKVVAGSYISARALALAEEAIVGLLAMKGKLVVVVMVIGLAVGGAGWASVSGLGEKSASVQERKTQTLRAKEQAPGPVKNVLPIAMDQYGDPLPEGAVARLGAQRFRAFAPALAFTPDGKTVVAKTVHDVLFWDAATGKELRRLPVGGTQRYYGYPEYTMDVYPDGTMLAIDETSPADKETKVSLRELLSGKRIRTLSFPREDDGDRFFRDLRFTSDGKSLVASYLGKVFVFDLASGRARMILKAPAYRVYSLGVSSDSKVVAAALEFREPGVEQVRYSVHLIDIAAGKLLRAIDDLPKDSGRPVPAFAPDGKMLAVGISERILLLDPETGKELGRLKSKIWEERRLAFTRDGKKLVCGGNGTAMIWDVVRGTILHTFQGNGTDGGYIALSPDGKTMALGTSGATVSLWDLDTGKERFTEYHSHDSAIGVLAFSPDAKTLVSSAGGYGPERVLLWNTAGWQRSGTLPLAGTLSFSSDGKHLAVLGYDRLKDCDRIRIWDFAARKETSAITFPDTSLAFSAVFSPDGRKLFTLDNNSRDKNQEPGKHRLRRWDVASGRQDQLWIIPQGMVPSSVASDGKTVAAELGPGGITIIDAATGRERMRHDEFQKWNRLSLSPDARVLASWDSTSPDDGHRMTSNIRLWEIATGKEIFRLKGREKLATPVIVAWSADGRLLASGENESREVHTVRLWDAAAGKELTQFAGLKEEITTLIFSPDTAFLACGLADGTTLIFDVAKADSKFTASLGGDVLASCWTDLSSDDAAQAHRAIGTLIGASKQSVPLLKKRLKAIAAFDAAKIYEWIAELDSDQFAVRQGAAKRLEALGGQIQPHIQKALKAGISLEARRRLEQILYTVTGEPGQDALRTIRAIMALERIGSPDAQTVLESLARGAPGARETEEAKASLERLVPRISKAR